MAREFAKTFYKSKAWLQCRSAYIAKRKAIDGGLCESCHERPGCIVHHKIELTPYNINNPDISLGHSNLKYDCIECHNQENGRGSHEVPGLVQYVFGVNGEVIPVPEGTKL